MAHILKHTDNKDKSQMLKYQNPVYELYTHKGSIIIKCIIYI